MSCGRVAESEVGEADSFGCGSVAVGFDGGHALDPYYAVGEFSLQLYGGGRLQRQDSPKNLVQTAFNFGIQDQPCKPVNARQLLTRR